VCDRTDGGRDVAAPHLDVSLDVGQLRIAQQVGGKCKAMYVAPHRLQMKLACNATLIPDVESDNRLIES